MTADRVRVAAHAKVNLFLRILAREDGGFHQLETAFQLLDLADDLVVTRTPGGVELALDGPDLGAPDDNLAVRAARAALAVTGERFGVRIELTKRIPARAGLGGGSSDAAAALLAVNALAGGAVPGHELLLLGARRRDGLPALPGHPAALSRQRVRRLHRLDAAHRPARAFSGGHRHVRSVAVQERAGDISAELRRRRTQWCPPSDQAA
jgi:4-diphosphocytidyl-2-C-methyl-D-erythritol kinase